MYKKALSVIVALSSLSILNAQFVSTPVNVRTPYGNVTTYIPSYMPMYYGGRGPVSRKYDYTAILKDGTSFSGYGKINIDKNINRVKLKNKDSKETKEFVPSETKELYSLLASGQKISGIPFHDSCWLFLTTPGKVNLYAILPEYGTEYVSAMQTGENAPIEWITKEKVMALVNDNPKAFKKAKKGKVFEALMMYNTGVK